MICLTTRLNFVEVGVELVLAARGATRPRPQFLRDPAPGDADIIVINSSSACTVQYCILVLVQHSRIHEEKSLTTSHQHSMASGSPTLMARHPLQRLSSPSRGFSAIVHFAGIISFSLSYKYLLENHTIVSDSYGWHFQYLTILGLTVAFFTFLSGLLYAFPGFPFPTVFEGTAASKLPLCSQSRTY